MDHNLPSDVATEKAVLGAILQDSLALGEIEHLLVPHDFSVQTHHYCYRAMLEISLNGGVIDKLTLLNKLKEHGVDTVTDDLLVDMISTCEHTENVSDYAKIIRDKSARRTAIKKLGKALRSLTNDSDDTATILTELTETANRIFVSASNVKYRKVNEIIMDCIAKLKEKSQPEYKDLSILPTGLVELDRHLKGHRLGCLDVIAARPSMGKTSLALSILLNISGRLMIPSMLISLEMTESQLGDKILAMRTGVDFSKIEEPKNLNAKEWKDLAEKVGSLEQLNLHIDDSSYTPTDIIATIRSGARDGIKYFVVDHLHLISYGDNQSPRHQLIGRVTKSLASLAKELDIHVTVLSQLNRDIEKREKHFPTLADLKDSSDIEMDATAVLFIDREDYYNEDVPIGDAKIIIAKNRYGERGRQCEVSFLPNIHLFCNKKPSNVTFDPVSSEVN